MVARFPLLPHSFGRSVLSFPPGRLLSAGPALYQSCLSTNTAAQSARKFLKNGRTFPTTIRQNPALTAPRPRRASCPPPPLCWKEAAGTSQTTATARASRTIPPQAAVLPAARIPALPASLRKQRLPSLLPSLRRRQSLPHRLLQPHPQNRRFFRRLLPVSPLPFLQRYRHDRTLYTP